MDSEGKKEDDNRGIKDFASNQVRRKVERQEKLSNFTQKKFDYYVKLRIIVDERRTSDESKRRSDRSPEGKRIQAVEPQRIETRPLLERRAEQPNPGKQRNGLRQDRQGQDPSGDQTGKTEEGAEISPNLLPFGEYRI